MQSFKKFGRHYTSECRKCEGYVQVTEKPLPNDIDISGTAVAMNCPIK